METFKSILMRKIAQLPSDDSAAWTGRRKRNDLFKYRGQPISKPLNRNGAEEVFNAHTWVSF